MTGLVRNKLFNWLFIATAALFLAACATDPVEPDTATLTVAIAGTGSGSVTSDVGDIDCSGAADDVCSADFDVDDATDVTLTATADAGSSFSGWSGDCTGMGDCVVTVTEDTDVTATFAADGNGGGEGDVTEVTITDAANDSEEFVSASTDDPTAFPANHSYTHSSDLDLVYDPSHETLQVIGLRFSGVTVPDGATIDSAEIVFTAAADAGTAGNLTVTIAGEDAAAPAPFEDDADAAGSADLSGRTELGTTVDWDITEEWTAGQTYATADVSTIVEELIALEGDDMVFLLSGSNETEYRIAESAGTDRTGPTLRIEYTPAGGGDTAE